MLKDRKVFVSGAGFELTTQGLLVKEHNYSATATHTHPHEHTHTHTNTHTHHNIVHDDSGLTITTLSMIRSGEFY